MKRSVNLKKRSTISPKPSRPVETESQGAQISLADKLVETIRNLTSNKDLLTTRISALNGDGLKTASIMEVSSMFRSLVSQVAVLYDSDDFQNIIAPFIERRFAELGSPSLTPGTIGSYIFGCYLSDYGLDSLSKFCTPICAASIRVPNRNRISMRCTEKVIWTDGGDTPLFILIDEDPMNSQNGKVFIPWVGDASSFVGLTQGAIDEIRSLGVENIEIYGQLFNNKYVQLMSRRGLSEITIVERIRLRSVDYVNSKNGGSTGVKISKSPAVQTKLPTAGSDSKLNAAAESSEPAKKDEPSMQKKDAATNIAYWTLLGFGILFLIIGIRALMSKR